MEGAGSRGKIGSEVALLAQLRHDKTSIEGSVMEDVCMLTFTREGEGVWVEDDTVVVRGVSDWMLILEGHTRES